MRQSRSRVERGGIVAVLVATLALGVAYAVRTPMWQAPDEPAHFNYIAQVAARPLDPPELEPGEYPQATLDRLIALRFPDDMPVDGLRYQDYQPPLYYYVAAVPFRSVGNGTFARLVAVRLLGAFFSVVTVALAYQVARSAVAGDEILAVGAAAFVAFVPMRIAVASSASNDAAAVLVMMAALLLALRRAGGTLDQRRFVAYGALVSAAALMTKVSAYPALPLLVAGEAARWWRAGRGEPARALVVGTAPAALGLLAAAPWLARNAATYGGLDILGTRAHNRIVVGQPRTSAWIDDVGAAAYLERLVTFTFRSFWGVFGWMGVFLANWMYAALALAVALAAVGLALRARSPAQRLDGPVHPERMMVLAVGLALTVAIFVAYNLAFVQHQGRYLLPAIGPIAVFLCLGWRHLAWTAVDRLVGRHRRPWAERLTLYGVAGGLAALAWIALVRYVVPGLS